MGLPNGSHRGASLGEAILAKMKERINLGDSHIVVVVNVVRSIKNWRGVETRSGPMIKVMPERIAPASDSVALSMSIPRAIKLTGIFNGAVNASRARSF